MKSIRSILFGAGLIASLNFVHAQQTVSSAQTIASDLDVMLQAVEQTTPMPTESLPRFGTFWSAQHLPGSRAAWPPLPGNMLGLDAWSLGDGSYLLNDTNVDYAELQAEADAEATLTTAGYEHSAIAMTLLSSWWIIETFESFNGKRIPCAQGTFIQWFSTNAFGGANYSNRSEEHTSELHS